MNRPTPIRPTNGANQICDTTLYKREFMLQLGLEAFDKSLLLLVSLS